MPSPGSDPLPHDSQCAHFRPGHTRPRPADSEPVPRTGSRSDGPAHALPEDPDAEVPPGPHPVLTVLAVALGGGCGATLRWAVGAVWPAGGPGGAAGGVPGGALGGALGLVPWPTFAANVIGCVALGVLTARLARARRPWAYLRPFLGVGVIGGFTTFSTYAEETRVLLASGHAPVALGYLLGSLVVGLLGVLAGLALGGVRRGGGVRGGGVR